MRGGNRWARFHRRLFRLGILLSEATPGHCFACSRTFNASDSDAKIRESFCSKICQDEFLAEYFKTSDLSECTRAFEITTALLGRNGGGP
jgi:hypothetical protein